MERAMFKQTVIALAFTLVPGMAMAQHHQHDAAKKQQHGHDKVTEHHKDFAQQLIEKRADLKLTDAQVSKLQGLSMKMRAHHKAMGADAQMDADAEEKMHGELLKVLTKEQVKQVHALMKEHMKEMCGGEKEGQCKIEKPTIHRE
jgi:hypothetical protein